MLPEYVCQDEAALWSEYIDYLENNFKRLDALKSQGSVGGEQEKWAVAGSRLWLARAQKAFAEGHRKQAMADMTKAFNFSQQAIDAVAAAYETNSATQADLLQAARLRLVIRRALLVLKNCKGNEKERAESKRQTMIVESGGPIEVLQRKRPDGKWEMIIKIIVDSSPMSFRRMTRLEAENEKVWYAESTPQPVVPTQSVPAEPEKALERAQAEIAKLRAEAKKKKARAEAEKLWYAESAPQPVGVLPASVYESF